MTWVCSINLGIVGMWMKTHSYNCIRFNHQINVTSFIFHILKFNINKLLMYNECTRDENLFIWFRTSKVWKVWMCKVHLLIVFFSFKRLANLYYELLYELHWYVCGLWTWKIPCNGGIHNLQWNHISEAWIHSDGRYNITLQTFLDPLPNHGCEGEVYH